jgi:hypothetical protein
MANLNDTLLIQKTYTLRRFSPADLEAVININRVCLPENYAPYFFIDTFNSFPDAFVVALLPDTGMRYLSKVYNDEWMRERGYVESAVYRLLTCRSGAQNPFRSERR